MKKAGMLFSKRVKIVPLIIMVLLVGFCRQINKTTPGISTRLALQASTGNQQINPSSYPPKDYLRGDIGKWRTIPCVFKTSDTVVLSWDASVNYLDTVRFYILSYLNDTNAGAMWLPFKDTVKAPQHQDTIHRKDFAFGRDSIFYFRVQSITLDGVASDWHDSYDSTALPAGGWKLCWKQK